MSDCRRAHPVTTNHALMAKAATRALVEALAVQGQTGPQRASALLGKSLAQITRYCSDPYPDLMPLPSIMQLESACQQPVVARALAALTYHSVVPADAGGAGDADLMRDFALTVSADSQFAHEFAEAAASGRFTLRVRRKLLAEANRLVQVIERDIRDLGREDS